MDQIKPSTYKPTKGPSGFQQIMQVGKNVFLQQSFISTPAATLNHNQYKDTNCDGMSKVF